MGETALWAVPGRAAGPSGLGELPRSRGVSAATSTVITIVAMTVIMTTSITIITITITIIITIITASITIIISDRRGLRWSLLRQAVRLLPLAARRLRNLMI